MLAPQLMPYGHEGLFLHKGIEEDPFLFIAIYYQNAQNCFQNAYKCLVFGALPRTPLGELPLTPDPLASRLAPLALGTFGKIASFFWNPSASRIS